MCTYFAASFKTVFLLHNLTVAGYAQPFNLYGQNVVSLVAGNAGIANATSW
jgi:general stress protein CsbA